MNLHAISRCRKFNVQNTLSVFEIYSIALNKHTITLIFGSINAKHLPCTATCK